LSKWIGLRVCCGVLRRGRRKAKGGGSGLGLGGIRGSRRPRLSQISKGIDHRALFEGKREWVVRISRDHPEEKEKKEREKARKEINVFLATAANIAFGSSCFAFYKWGYKLRINMRSKGILK